jgi:hypothetical protein
MGEKQNGDNLAQLKGCCHEMQLGQIRCLKQRNHVKQWGLIWDKPKIFST